MRFHVGQSMLKSLSSYAEPTLEATNLSAFDAFQALWWGHVFLGSLNR